MRWRLLLVLLVAAMPISACAHAQTLTAHDGSNIRPPLGLRQAIRAVDRLLDPKSIEALRSGEVTPAQLHLGFGMYLRNAWSLWHGSTLARWFGLRGIHHPDDMSSIILDSYVRHLRGEPIALRGQIAHYKSYWAEARAFEQAEREAGPKRAARIESERMGWTFVDREVPTLRSLEPPVLTRTGGHESDMHSMHVAKLEPYDGGVLVFGRHVHGEPQQLWPNWHTGVFWLADAGAELERVRRHDCEEIHDALTLAETTHWLCRNGEFWVVLDEPPGTDETSLRATGLEAEYLRLGSHGDELLLLSPDAVYRWQDQAWRAVYARDEAWFPAEASVPRQLGDGLFFLAEIRWERRMVRVDLSAPSSAPVLDWCWPLLREYYGPWANYCYSLTPSQTGGLWLTAGHRFYETAMLLSEGPNQVAIFEGSVDRPIEFSADDGLLRHAELDESTFRRQLPASAMVERDDAVYLAGEFGIAVSRAGRVEPLVRFAAPYEQLHNGGMGSQGPRELALFAGEPPSFALRVGVLAVVRATEAGYELRWPNRP